MLVDRTTRAVTAAVMGIALASALALGHAAGTEVGVAQSDAHGTYLVDTEGMSLYLFLRDTDGESACYDQCAAAWPPLLTDEAPVALDGVDSELLGTTDRTDGTTQVTYAGWPLYFFVQDQAAGDVAGQGVNDVWYLVSPDGEVIGAEVEDAGDDIAEFMELGGRVYAQHCAVCHGAEGNEALVQYTVILDGYGRLSDGSRAIRAVINGRGNMPAIGAGFSSEQVAAVVTYVRNSWSNSHGPVSVSDVDALR